MREARRSGQRSLPAEETRPARFDGAAWNTTSTKGVFDWGTVISGTTVSCNHVVGSNDFVKANATTSCPTSDPQDALAMTLSKEGVYQQDVNHDDPDGLSFIHSGCATLYGGGDGEANSGTEAARETSRPPTRTTARVPTATR